VDLVYSSSQFVFVGSYKTIHGNVIYSVYEIMGFETLVVKRIVQHGCMVRPSTSRVVSLVQLFASLEQRWQKHSHMFIRLSFAV
jgi:hypothetical protein